MMASSRSAVHVGAATEVARPDRPASYTRVQVALHWLVAALVVEQYATSGAIVRTHTVHMIGQQQSPTDLVLHTMHNRLGLALTALMAFRLAYCLWAGAPAPLARGTKSAWTSRAASVVHAAFYGVLICEGIAGAVASYLWWPASALHVVLFEVLLALLASHVGAVLVHLVLGTPVLARMGLGWVSAPRALGTSRIEESAS
jgi:cytochrome b561